MEPIAICGMACRLPGGISSPQELWEFLVSKRDGKSRVPADRYNTDGHSSRIPRKPGSTRSDFGYFIDDDLQSFDASVFGMSVAELERCDPQQRLMLLAAYESVADAGEERGSIAGRRVGVYMGVSERGWGDLYEKETQNYGQYSMLGTGDFALSNRVSYELDLKGPSMTVRTACASSLSALNEACKAISAGEAESAIVGGASIILGTSMTLQMAEQGALAEDGSCKTFSKDANGYGRAEAINAVYIKPLSAAIRDGNPVRAVIRGVATNHNGRNGGITVPNASAQEALIKQAYESAGITNLSDTGFVECHGTGTPVGDPLETKAVGAAFSSDINYAGSHLYIGSVKPNLGHSEGASGLTSVLKAVLALENKTIPPNIKMGTPNPAIPFEKYNLKVPLEPTPWPADRKERVSVNNFGIGGANAHVVLDSADSFGLRPQLEEAGDHAQLLVFSAKSPESLKSIIGNYNAYLAKHPERIEDVAYTLANRREHFGHRAFLVASREKPGKPSVLSKPPTGPAPNIVFVFTGQGAQWPQMGRDLLRTNKVFKATIKSLDETLKSLSPAPGWTIEGELKKAARTSKVTLAEFSQPLCTAVQVGLVDALKAIGIQPNGVVGHSSGEIAGAYAAGALSAGDAIVAAYYRGAVAKQQNRPGAMAAIGLGPEEVKEFLIPNVGIACENSPRSVTLSGDATEVVKVVAAISEAKPDVLARLLKVDKAYHSYHMAEVGGVYSELVGPNVGGRAAEKPFFSSVEGRLLTKNDKLDAKYWQKNLESTVRFTDAVTAITQHPVGQNAVYLEVGPHSALAGPLRQILAATDSKTAPYVASMIRGQDCTESLLAAVGSLYSLHVPVDFNALYPSGVTLPGLPSYAWNNNRVYWHETRVMKDFRDRPFKHHALLGLRTLESTDFEPEFRNLFHLEAAPWVRDHQINGDVVYPFAAYVAMAGEAVRQITGVSQGFQLRNTSATTALVVHEDKPVELITAFRRRKLADGSDSRWWDFSISSHNGHVWVKNFTGEATAFDKATVGAAGTQAPLPRSVDVESWYAAVDRTGFIYGPTFRLLQDLKSTTTRPGRVTATVRNNLEDDEAKESDYHIHPTAVDNVFQLLPAASLLGQGKKLGLNVITGIGEITVTRSAAQQVSATVTGQTEGNGSLRGSGDLVVDGQVVLRTSDITFSVLGYPDEGDAHAASRLAWKSHVDFVAPEKLLKPSQNLDSSHAAALTELTDLAVLYSKRAISAQGTPTAGHLQRYQSWVQEHAKGDTEADLESGALLEAIIKKAEGLQGTSAGDLAQAISRIATAATDIFAGNRDGLDLLSEGNLLNKVLALVNEETDISAYLSTLAHTQPNLRILELGAGFGAQTSKYLQALGSQYSKYTFTDPSQRLVAEGKEHFKNGSNLEFAPLDIGGDLGTYGFDDEKRQGSYDLIIATNSLHQTDDLVKSIRNARSLLKPRGRLLLQELAPPSASSQWVTFVLGVLPSWWYSASADLGITAPMVEEALQGAGFAEPDIKVVDGQLNNVVVVRPKHEAEPKAKEIAILTTDANADGADELHQQLTARGYDVSRISLYDEPPANKDIVALLDSKKGSFLADISAKTYDRLNKFLVNLAKSQAGLFWITGLAGEAVSDPHYGLVVGLARTLRTEIDAEFAVLQTAGEFTDSRVVDVFEHFHRRKAEAVEAAFDPETEYVINQTGDVQVGRYYPFTLADELLEKANADGEAVLSIGRAGNLEDLKWSSRTVSRAPEHGEVEVEIHAAGLTDKDLANALGTSGHTDKPTFGLEAAGVVRRLGSGVTHLKVGDRVVLLGRETLATAATIPAQLVVKIPSTLSFADAAALPLAYTTALHALLDVGRLESGDTVLIHNAASGVGIAATQAAALVGARVLATTENEEQTKFLVDEFDLATDSIFSLQNASFVDDVHRATNGRGADVVLNSLTGDLLHASWQVVAECGTLVDVTNNALARGAGLELHPFRQNRSYTAVDIDHLRSQKPAVVARHLQHVIKLYRDGRISAIKPSLVFSASDVSAAFTHARQGPIGKTVVQIRPEAGGPAELTPTVRSRQPVTLDREGSYLLVGGLGGIGRQVAIWLAEQGAGNILLLSRSAGSSPDHEALVKELNSIGSSVQLVKGSVTELADVQAAVANAKFPVRGILQLSAVLRDRDFADITSEDWEVVTAPKVKGTWNLHNATLDSPIDFFVSFGSISAVIGQPGQANYVAANAFLDSFAHYRRGLGLPATTIDVGVVEEVGIAARRNGFLNSVKAMGFLTVRETQILDAISLAINRSAEDTFAIGLGSSTPLSSADNRLFWKKDPRFGVYHNRSAGGDGGSGGSGGAGIKAFLQAVKTDHSLLKQPETPLLLAKEIGTKVLSLLGKPVDELQTSQGLSDLGMDSLVGIEVRKWWKTTFGFDVSLLEMLGMGTLEVLGGHAVNGLKKVLGVE
ncbi:lovastatin diketide synthase LovF [Podospora australis]|uniref:Lovastatin diketide synthase LovF n=1 Tax=Podospora australis TaxID=1536484 RepID=A0AAN6WP04_9PEZI|nr:lovastatin diketide synthase LovF [Podospora australis]